MARLVLDGAYVEVYQKEPTSAQYVTLTEMGGKPVKVTNAPINGLLVANFKELVGHNKTGAVRMFDIELEVATRDFVDKESGRSNQTLMVQRVLKCEEVVFVRAGAAAKAPTS